MENLDKFLKDPSEKNALNLDEYMYTLLYSWCQYCIDNQPSESFVEKARDILRIIKPIIKRRLCSFDKNGLKSIILACKMLISMNNDKSLKPLRPQDSLKTNEFINSFEVFMKDDEQKNSPSFEIYYEPYKYSEKTRGGTFYSLKDQFNIKQEYSVIGMSKELNMYKKETQEYFEDIFNNNNCIVDKIIFKQKTKGGIESKNFYDNRIGITWKVGQDEKCIECLEKLFDTGKLPKDCENKVIENECYSEIRNKPENLSTKINEILYGKEVSPQSKRNNSPVFENVYEKLKETKEMWECTNCLMQNESSLTKCKACEEPRQ